MAEPAATGAPKATVFFELERFEHRDGQRLEVGGRWFGIRGRRFVRPTLTLLAGGQRVRALADLEHKPWAVDDGARWEAAFSWDRSDEVQKAELAVAPDLVIRLPRPGAEMRSPERLVPLTPGDKGDGGPPQIVRPARARGRQADGMAGGTSERRASARERALQRELDRRREELERAESRLRETAHEREELAKELERANRLLSELRETATGRAATKQAEQQATAQRDAALAERDAAFAERDRLRLERDRLTGERKRLIAERDRALEAREQALARSRPVVAPRSVEPSQTVLAPTPIAATPDPAANWWHRSIAVAVLIAVLIACAILLHVP